MVSIERMEGSHLLVSANRIRRCLYQCTSVQYQYTVPVHQCTVPLPVCTRTSVKYHCTDTVPVPLVRTSVLSMSVTVAGPRVHAVYQLDRSVPGRPVRVMYQYAGLGKYKLATSHIFTCWANFVSSVATHRLRCERATRFSILKYFEIMLFEKFLQSLVLLSS